MSEKQLERLNKYAARCKVIASAKVYESDKEVAESIKSIKSNSSGTLAKRVCTFAVAKKV